MIPQARKLTFFSAHCLVLPQNEDPRGAVIGEIAKPHELKHAETTDKSAPIIEGTSRNE